jgi:hypothetical protein
MFKETWPWAENQLAEQLNFGDGTGSIVNGKVHHSL